MSRQRRHAIGLGTAAVIGTAVIASLSWDASGDGKRAGNNVRTTAHTTATPPASQTRRRGSWIAQANAVCRLGRKLYPSVALGAKADPDDMDYAVNRLVNEIAAIPARAPASARQSRLAWHGRAAASAWHAIANRPVGDVTGRERREAERLSGRYVDELVTVGAGACAPLRLAAP